jgi:hypothetical protein
VAVARCPWVVPRPDLCRSPELSMAARHSDLPADLIDAPSCCITVNVALRLFGHARHVSSPDRDEPEVSPCHVCARVAQSHVLLPCYHQYQSCTYNVLKTARLIVPWLDASLIDYTTCTCPFHSLVRVCPTQGSAQWVLFLWWPRRCESLRRRKCPVSGLTQMEVVVLCVAECDECPNDVDERCLR